MARKEEKLKIRRVTSDETASGLPEEAVVDDDGDEISEDSDVQEEDGFICNVMRR